MAAVESEAMSTVCVAHLGSHLDQAATAVETLLAKAKAKVAALVMPGGKINSRLLDEQQHAAHGLAWLATYAATLRELVNYATRLEAEGKFGETEQLTVQIAAGEYLNHVAGGIPMNQGEFIRLPEFGLTRSDAAGLHDLVLIEDDAYGSLEPKAQPIATLIPERSYLAMTLSKCMAPALRVAYVLAPDRAAASVLANALRTVSQMPVPLMVALVSRWLADGSADAIVSAVATEAAARQKLAAKALLGHSHFAHPTGHHVWLRLPAAWTRAEFAAHVQRQGLAVVTSDSFSVDGEPDHAIRIALGAARNRSELVAALDVLVVALKSPAYASRIV